MKKLENVKTPKIFSKNLRSKKVSEKNYEGESSEEESKMNKSKEGKKLKKSKSNIGYHNENFENSIIKAYEKLSLYYKGKKKDKKKEENEYNPELISCLKSCEKN